MEENQKARQRLGFRTYNLDLATLLVVAAMSALRGLVLTVFASTQIFLAVGHHSRVSGCFLVDDLEYRHIDQSYLAVFDYKGPKVVGKETDLEELVEGCGRTCWLIIADEM